MPGGGNTIMLVGIRHGAACFPYPPAGLDDDDAAGAVDAGAGRVGGGAPRLAEEASLFKSNAWAVCAEFLGA